MLNNSSKVTTSDRAEIRSHEGFQNLCHFDHAKAVYQEEGMILKGKRKIKDNQGLFATGLKKYAEGTIIHRLFILVKTRDHSCLFKKLD